MRKSQIHHRSQTTRERGMALALAIFAMAALLVGATGALFVGADDIQASRNYRSAQQAKYAAESGLTDALQTINAVGVVDFQAQLVDNWDVWLGSNPIDFALPGYSYRVEPIADPANPITQGWLRATASGPEGVMNVEVARVQQSNIPGTAPGAIYLANDTPTNATFQGDNFQVDGRDYLLNGSLNAGADAQPGIATRNDTNTQETINSLNNIQKDNVQGDGYVAGSPPTPAVKTAPSAANVDQFNALIDALLAQGANEFSDTQINNSNDATYGAPICGLGCCDGTSNNPVISHFTADELKIRGDGNVSGCGIMIVEGDLVIQGTLDFQGLILVRGGTSVEADSELGFTGDATIYGSIWTSDLNLVVGGSALVRYSTAALSYANSVIPSGAFPAPLDVLALADCSQVPSGSAGCP